MNNPYYSWIFSQQPQRITIKSPQNGQDLTLFVHPGQTLPKSSVLVKVENKIETPNLTRTLPEIMREALAEPKATKIEEKNSRGRRKTELKAEIIEKHLKEGLSQKEIGKIYNCTDRTIRNILNSKKAKIWDL